jgi:hypothetical protein
VKLLHDEGLPVRHACHTSPARTDRTARG